MVTTHLSTAADLETMDNNARFELVRGVLHEMSPSSFNSSLVMSNLALELGQFVKHHRLGSVTFAEAGYLLERNPDTVVAPDIAFVRIDRIPQPVPKRGFFVGMPDLVIEIISPSDEPAEIRRKQALYDRIGIPLVWWIDPDRRVATVHRAGRPVGHLTESDSLDGADIIPGFSLSLSQVFDFS